MGITYDYDSAEVGESTMHTGMKKHLNQSDFEEPLMPATLERLNSLIVRKEFDKLTNERPTGFLEERELKLSYQALITIYHARKNHKVKQWKMLCDWIESLPYMKDFLL